MRYIYLMGAAGTGKSAVAKKIASDLDNSRVLDISTTWEKKQGFPLGNLVDYRVEAALATERAMQSFSTHPKNAGVDYLVVANSPLTNLAYAVRAADQLEKTDGRDTPEFEQWFTTTGFLWRLVQDSVWNDLFFFLSGHKDTVGEDIEEILKVALTNIGLEYNTLQGTNLQKCEKAAKIIKDATWLI